MPDVPTLNEALGRTGLSMVSWLGLVAPAGTPRPVIARINTELRAILADPAFVREKLSPASYELCDFYTDRLFAAPAVAYARTLV